VFINRATSNNNTIPTQRPPPTGTRSQLPTSLPRQQSLVFLLFLFVDRLAFHPSQELVEKTIGYPKIHQT
jgi:hypothetical protein